MKLFVLVNEGLEKYASTEIKELTGSNSVTHNNVLEFEIDNTENFLSFVNVKELIIKLIRLQF